jgi:putative flavoprotein involved in K+ transport
MATVNTVVIGGGQAGPSVSHYLKQLSVAHVVLEQADKPGEAWRNHRWDSFVLNTPRWQSRLPGVRYGEDDPDGFMPRREVVAHLDEIAQRLPVRTRARVVSVARNAATGDYVVSIDRGEKIGARNVVVATGLHQTPKIPELGRGLPAGVRRLHSDSYRNPAQLLPGAVLVVGSAQSGAQIAEELYESGRKVYLATGRAGRTPRRYRGKDANWWFARMGHYDHKVSELSSPRKIWRQAAHLGHKRRPHAQPAPIRARRRHTAWWARVDRRRHRQAEGRPARQSRRSRPGRSGVRPGRGCLCRQHRYVGPGRNAPGPA